MDRCPIFETCRTRKRYMELQEDYESAVDLLASDIIVESGVDPITAVEMAKKRIKQELLSE